MQIVFKAKSLAKYYYYIKHDSDHYTEADDGVENPHAVGELKDPHVHLLFTFNSSRDLSTVRNYFSEFGELKENSFERINNAHGAKRYLIHADDPDKHQYKMVEVETNDKLFSNIFVEKISVDEEICVLREAMKTEGAIAFDDYFQKFVPLLSTMNSYGKAMISFHIKSEWRYITGGGFDFFRSKKKENEGHKKPDAKEDRLLEFFKGEKNENED